MPSKLTPSNFERLAQSAAARNLVHVLRAERLAQQAVADQVAESLCPKPQSRPRVSYEDRFREWLEKSYVGTVRGNVFSHKNPLYGRTADAIIFDDCV